MFPTPSLSSPTPVEGCCLLASHWLLSIFVYTVLLPTITATWISIIKIERLVCRPRAAPAEFDRMLGIDNDVFTYIGNI